MDVDVLFNSNLVALEELDISENKWLCDKNILKGTQTGFIILKLLRLVADWIRNHYSDAAKHSRTFFLANAAKTTCDRPYKLQGKNLMDLQVSDVGFNYDEKLDTTTVATVVENVTDSVSQETTTLIDFSKVS